MPRSEIHKKLLSSRKELLDIGLRNNMLNFRLTTKSLSIVLTVRPFLRWFNRNGLQPRIDLCGQASNLQNPPLHRAQRRHMAERLLRQLDHGQRDFLKRFQ